MNEITRKQFILILGASGKTGSFIAAEFARQNKHLILASPGGALPNLCSFLENKYDVVTHYYETDFSEVETPEIFHDWLSARFELAGVVVNLADWREADYASISASLFRLAARTLPSLSRKKGAFLLHLQSAREGRNRRAWRQLRSQAGAFGVNSAAIDVEPGVARPSHRNFDVISAALFAAEKGGCTYRANKKDVTLLS